MANVSEEFVTKTVISYLREHNWTILDYDFPGGGSGRSFKTTEIKGKNKGNVIVDIIAAKGTFLLCIESKKTDTLSDYKKVQDLSQNCIFINNLKEAYRDSLSISSVYFGICFSGKWKKGGDIAEYPDITIVFSVVDKKVCLVYNKSSLFTP